MFINFARDKGLTISNYRITPSYSGTILDLLQAVQDDEWYGVSCILDGAKDTLLDGEALAGFDQDVVESIYNLIVDHENFINNSFNI